MKILREKEVVRITSLSRVTIWRLEAAGMFPKRVRISPGRVGWREMDILAWIEKND